MTIAQAIELVNRLVPNQVSDTDKVDWLNDLDLHIYKTIISAHCMPDMYPSEFNGYSESTDPETILLVPTPFDELYRWYLEMHIHGANGETARYNGAAEKYNSSMQNYMDYINRNYPSKGRRVRWW